MKKVTRATFKSFINKNRENLLICAKSSFNGMIDMVDYDQEATFSKARPSERCYDNNLGIQGIWLVGQSRDWFEKFETDEMAGFSVSNCCGSFEIAVQK